MPHNTLPVGTIREYKRKGSPPRTRIKIKVGSHTLWEDYPRYVYRTNKGPIPEGKCVLHKDGDPRNFDPKNLVLGTIADAAYLWAARNPEKAMGTKAGIRRGNLRAKKRAVARRLSGEIMPSMWYTRDPVKREIHGPHGKQYRDAVAYLGFVRRRHYLPCYLGRPGHTPMEAAILTVLAREPEREWPLQPLTTAVREVNVSHGYENQWLSEVVNDVLGRLAKRGLVATRKGDDGHSLRRIAPDAIATETPVELRRPIRGKEIPKWEEDGYRLIVPDVSAMIAEIKGLE